MSSRKSGDISRKVDKRGAKFIRILKLMTHRVFWVVIGIGIQVAVLLLVLLRFRQLFQPFEQVCLILTIVMAIIIVNKKMNPAFQIAWLFVMILVPLSGWLLYLLFGGVHLSWRTKKYIRQTENRIIQAQRGNLPNSELTREAGEDAGNMGRYLDSISCPAYRDTQVEYFPLGEIEFESMLQRLRLAKHYIFLEYFIIEPGIMWDSILAVLREKVKQGVEVRVLYDDMGCIFTLPYNYRKTLESMGIQCRVFNRFTPVVSIRANNRSHQKMLVVDGMVAYTGGINLADEYINEKVRFGHWKDVGIALSGQAAWGMTLMFFNMWGFAGRSDEDFTPYQPHEEIPLGRSSVQPYADNPLDSEPVGETVYLKMINQAKHYLYLTTPYLIIDHATSLALTSAAKSGVDVRIITPHIPDKRMVFEVTRAHYTNLISGGVKVYEYTPGFIHAKLFAVDDRIGTVGTVNMDYRSMFLHYENGVVIYDPTVVSQLKEDFLDTLSKSEQITEEMLKKVPLVLRAVRALLRLFAPLM